MKVVSVQAEVNLELCTGCKTCQMVCPVYAIKVSRQNKKPRVDIDLESEPLGFSEDGKPVFMHEIWPSQEEIFKTLKTSIF